ncbi:MAG: two-component regulator propeller domain-containing protein [Thermonemataceae bacterium]
MLLRKLILLLLCILGAYLQLAAQQYNFRVYSLDDGLPQSEVHDILQDQRGAIWLATNGGGVCRFNGRSFQVVNQKKGLTNNKVKKLFEDSKGHLWFITERGINRYNGHSITTFTEKEGFTSGSKFRMVEDPQGKLWVVVKQEMSVSKILYFQNNQFVDFSAQYLPLIKNNQIEDILLTEGGKLLIGTQKGLYEFDGDQLSLSPLNKKDELAGKRIVPLLKDSQDRLWLLYDMGINTQLAYYKNKQLTTITLDEEKIEPNNYLTIYEDKTKGIWLSFDDYGMGRFTDDLSRQYFNKNNGLPSDMIVSIYQDSEENMWFGTSGAGLVKYVGEQFINFDEKDGLDSDFVWTIFQDSQDNIWFGTSGDRGIGGLCKYDGKQVTKVGQGRANNLKRVKDIHELPSGALLIATYEGLWQYSNGNFTKVNSRYGIPLGAQVSSICETRAGDLWFGTIGYGAISYQSGDITLFNTQKKNVVSNLVRDIIEDNKGNIWIATQYGVSKWNGKAIQNFGRNEGMLSDYVIHLDKDNKGNIWMATFGGVTRFDGKVFTTYTTEDGLPSNSIYSLIFTKQKEIWAGTQKGIAKLSLDEKYRLSRVKTYGIYEGFTGIENNSNAIFQDAQNNIWFGTVKGAIRYAPVLENGISRTPIVNITHLRLFFKEVRWTKSPYKQYHEGLQAWSKLPKVLKLPYHLNHVSFDFEGLQYSVPEGIRYKWMLENVDKEWTPATYKNEAVYPNLPPGKYTFKIIASNSDGIWTSQPTIYRFEILPPFWKTVVFKILLIVLIVLLLFLTIRWRLTIIEQQKKELEEAVTQAKADLLVQNEELKRQQVEIQEQRTNLEALNATKDKFFSILAHDIKGPLNSLTAFLDIMSKHSEEMSQEDVQFMSSSLNKSVKNLYSLLENVLSWSRSQMGVLEYAFAPIPLKKIVDDALQLLEVSAHNKGIDLFNHVDETIVVYVDVNSINTVFRNLISNAIKFTSVDGKVQVNARVTPPCVEVTIEDNGLGMSKKVQERIFQLDKRISTKGTANETGTGLGLILCKEFVEKNEGKIWVESEEGKGTTFIFTLPLVDKDTLIEHPDNEEEEDT